MRFLAGLAAVSLCATGAAAQTTQAGAAPSSAPPAATWSVEAGYESFWLRDVARTTPRADASPVSWEGEGPTIEARYDRASPKRLHRFSFAFSSAGHFAYDAIVRTIPRSPEDGVVRVDGRYEYRRYPFRDLWMDGLDVGIGVQGLADHVSSTHHLDPSIEISRGETDLGVSVVAVARVRRWSKLDVEVAWVNGMVFTRTGVHHSEDTLAAYEQWGGGWLTDLALVATVPVSRRAGIRATYFRSGQGHYASHDSYASGRSRLLVGVAYGR